MLYSEFLTCIGAPDNQISYVGYTGLNRIYIRHNEYTCGYCNFSVNEEDEYCRACGAKFYKMWKKRKRWRLI